VTCVQPFLHTLNLDESYIYNTNNLYEFVLSNHHLERLIIVYVKSSERN
jgi:hypothetical protein